MSLLNEIRERKVPQWLTAYIGGAWFALQVINLLSPQFGWSTNQQRILTYSLAAAVVPAAVLAWFYGKKGFQGVNRRQLIVLGALLLILGFGIMQLNSYMVRQAEVTFLASAKIKILRVDPPAGTLLRESDLVNGVPITVSIEQSFPSTWLGGSPPKRRKPIIYLQLVFGGELDTMGWEFMVLDKKESTWTARQMSLRGALNNCCIRNGKLTLAVMMMWDLDMPELYKDSESDAPISEPVLIEYPVEPLETTSPTQSE